MSIVLISITSSVQKNKSIDYIPTYLLLLLVLCTIAVGGRQADAGKGWRGPKSAANFQASQPASRRLHNKLALVGVSAFTAFS